MAVLTSVKNPADAVNVALMRIGWKGGDVGSLYEGSPASGVAINVYGQTRDALLRSSDWDFAQRTASLELQKSAPAGGYIPGITTWDPAVYPPPGWLFQYAYPGDCLKVRAVKPIPLFFPNFDPQPNTFSIANDKTVTPAQEVILSNVENAVCIYTGRVTDPQTWAPDFTDAFIDALALSMAPGLTGLDAAKLVGAEGGAAMAMAAVEQG